MECWPNSIAQKFKGERRIYRILLTTKAKLVFIYSVHLVSDGDRPHVLLVPCSSKYLSTIKGNNVCCNCEDPTTIGKYPHRNAVMSLFLKIQSLRL
jgi:hypothetical protein